MLSAKEVHANAETYMKQFFRVVDREKTELRWQSEWFGKFSLADVIGLTSKFTVAQLLAREDFSNRHASGRPIAITELLYPLLQAYDSVVIESDVEFGGTDQMFNCLMGRELQQMVGQPPQQVFMMPLLVGTDGRQKMSKSLDNYIAIEDTPDDMYGKVMSIPDSLISDYFELLTDVPDEELKNFKQQISSLSINPMALKKHLAQEIVGQFHSDNAARRAESNFESVVQKGEVPEDIPEYILHEDKIHIIDLLDATGLAKSRSEAKRQISAGSVKINGVKFSGQEEVISPASGSILQVGKRRWVKIVKRQP
jgi:tyrosyl-tRNA synthetase